MQAAVEFCGSFWNNQNWLRFFQKEITKTFHSEIILLIIARNQRLLFRKVHQVFHLLFQPLQ